MRGKLKLYLNECHYATILLDEIKNIEQNGAYWYIEMKNGNTLEYCNMAVITYDEIEKVGYFVKFP